MRVDIDELRNALRGQLTPLSTAVENVLQLVVDEMLVGGAFFGVPEGSNDPIGDHPRPTFTAAIVAPEADDRPFRLLPRRGRDELDLRYRGSRVQFDDVFTSGLREVDTNDYCCILPEGPEPSPNCLVQEDCSVSECVAACTTDPDVFVCEP